MISAISITALQGLKREESRINVIANNIANVNTPGFRKPGTEVLPTETEDEKALSNVDLAEEFVNLSQAKTGYQANLKVIAIEQDLTKSILDIIA